MTYPSKPSSAPAIPFNSVGRSKNINDIISAIGVEKLVALKTDGTYDDNFSIGDNTLNALVNEINIRQGSTIKEYDSTGANLLRTLTLGSATNLVQGFSYLDDPIRISNNATNPTTEIDVSAGIMTFDDGTGQVRLTTSLTKSTANDFANGGLLPNGAVLQTDTIYYVFVIYSSSSNLVSFYADTSKTNPTLPTSPNVYDKKQYRGAFYVDASGNITPFHQVSKYFFYKNNGILSQSILSSNLTSGALYSMKCPANVLMIPSVIIEDFSGASDNVVLLSAEINDNSVPSDTNGIFTISSSEPNGTDENTVGVGFLPILTNDNSEIRIRTAGSNGRVRVAVQGWIDIDLKD